MKKGSLNGEIEIFKMLMRHHGGEKKLWSVLRVPREEEEDGKNLGRELKVLKGDRTMTSTG